MHTIHRQHPIKIAVHLYRTIRYMIIPYTLLLFREIRAGTGQQPYWVYGVAVVIGLSILLWSIISWWKDTYQIGESEIVIQRGVLITTQRTIPLERITNISIEQTWTDRLVGSATAELHTSDSNEEADARFVLTRRNADMLLAKMNRPMSGVSNQAKPNWVLQPKDILMRAISSNSFWLGVPLCLTIVTYVWEWVEPSTEEGVSLIRFFQDEIWKEILTTELIPVLPALLGIIALCVFASWLLSLAMMQVRYHKWSVIRDSDYIHIQYGWYERKSISLHTVKIQSIRVKEQVFSRYLGYVSVWMDCVGYAGEKKVKLLLPAIHRSKMHTALEMLLPEFTIVNPQRHLPAGKAMYFVWLPVIAVSLVIVVSAILSLWAWLTIPFAAAIYWRGIRKYSGTLWEIDGNQCVIAKPGLTRTTVYVQRQAIQSITSRQTRIQRIFGIFQIELVIDSPSKAKEYVFTGASQEDVQQLLHWYKNRDASKCPCIVNEEKVV
ncbi:PH domain-containing protein [Paenibacillus thiaminolyticus]|uniref:PH domain-containing protein n=1 Tax=Paenibacillus thiaminolyticus TaxID=49283 RepID=UPI0035A5B159